MTPQPSPSTETALISTTIHLAALAYTHAITTSHPLSRTKPRHDIDTYLARNIKAMSPKRWKVVPGVYLWVTLVAVAQESDGTGNNNDGGEPRGEGPADQVSAETNGVGGAGSWAGGVWAGDWVSEGVLGGPEVAGSRGSREKGLNDAER